MAHFGISLGEPENNPEQGSEPGFFYQSSDRGERILLRRIELFDGAQPSGNALMFHNLLRLGHLSGNGRYLQAADHLARSYADTLRSHPTAHTFSLAALDYLLGPSYELVIAGRKDDPTVHGMITAVRKTYAPNTVVLFRPEEDEPPIAGISPFVREQRMVQGKPTFYLCTDFTCNLPLFEIDEVMNILRPVRK